MTSTPILNIDRTKASATRAFDAIFTTQTGGVAPGQYALASAARGYAARHDTAVEALRKTDPTRLADLTDQLLMELDVYADAAATIASAYNANRAEASLAIAHADTMEDASAKRELAAQAVLACRASARAFEFSVS